MLGGDIEEHLSNPFATAAPTPAPAPAAAVAPAQPRMESQSAFYASEQQPAFGRGASFGGGSGGGGGGAVFLRSAPGKECAEKLTPAWAKPSSNRHGTAHASVSRSSGRSVPRTANTSQLRPWW